MTYYEYKIIPSCQSYFLVIDSNVLKSMAGFLHGRDDRLRSLFERTRPSASVRAEIDPVLAMVEDCFPMNGDELRVSRARNLISTVMEWNDIPNGPNDVDIALQEFPGSLFEIHSFATNLLYVIKVHLLYRDVVCGELDDLGAFEKFLEWASDVDSCPILTPAPLVWGINFFDGVGRKRQRSRSISKLANVDGADLSDGRIAKASWNVAWDFTYRNRVNLRYLDMLKREGPERANDVNPALVSFDKDSNDIYSTYYSDGTVSLPGTYMENHLRAYPEFDSRHADRAQDALEERMSFRGNVGSILRNNGKREKELIYESINKVIRDEGLPISLR